MLMYALIQTSTSTVLRYEEFEGTPPLLAPEKDMQWMVLIKNYATCDETQVPGDPTITIDWEAMTCTKDYPAVTKPLPSVPALITMRQAQLQLLAIDALDAVDAAVLTMGRAAQIEWNKAAVVERQSPLVATMTQMMNWTEAQMDDYFRGASLL